MEDNRQWLKCPAEGCPGWFWRFHPGEVDYCIEIIQCPKCGKLWDLRGGELTEFERIPLNVRRRTPQV